MVSELHRSGGRASPRRAPPKTAAIAVAVVVASVGVWTVLDVSARAAEENAAPQPEGYAVHIEGASPVDVCVARTSPPSVLTLWKASVRVETPPDTVVIDLGRGSSEVTGVFYVVHEDAESHATSIRWVRFFRDETGGGPLASRHSCVLVPNLAGLRVDAVVAKSRQNEVQLETHTVELVSEPVQEGPSLTVGVSEEKGSRFDWPVTPAPSSKSALEFSALHDGFPTTLARAMRGETGLLLQLDSERISPRTSYYFRADDESGWASLLDDR